MLGFLSEQFYYPSVYATFDHFEIAYGQWANKSSANVQSTEINLMIRSMWNEEEWQSNKSIYRGCVKN